MNRRFKFHFSKGLNTISDTSLLTPDTMSKCDNFRVREDGGVQKMLGGSKISSQLNGGVGVRNAHQFMTRTGAREVFGECNGSIRDMSNNEVLEMNESNITNMAQWADKLILSDGSSNIETVQYGVESKIAFTAGLTPVSYGKGKVSVIGANKFNESIINSGNGYATLPYRSVCIHGNYLYYYYYSTGGSGSLYKYNFNNGELGSQLWGVSITMDGTVQSMCATDDYVYLRRPSNVRRYSTTNGTYDSGMGEKSTGTSTNLTKCSIYTDGSYIYLENNNTIRRFPLDMSSSDYFLVDSPSHPTQTLCYITGIYSNRLYYIHKKSNIQIRSYDISSFSSPTDFISYTLPYTNIQCGWFDSLYMYLGTTDGYVHQCRIVSNTVWDIVKTEKFGTSIESINGVSTTWEHKALSSPDKVTGYTSSGSAGSLDTSADYKYKLSFVFHVGDLNLETALSEEVTINSGSNARIYLSNVPKFIFPLGYQSDEVLWSEIRGFPAWSLELDENGERRILSCTGDQRDHFAVGMQLKYKPAAYATPDYMRVTSIGYDGTYTVVTTIDDVFSGTGISNIYKSLGKVRVSRKLYRTEGGGSIFYYLTEIKNNHTSVYDDVIPDSNLGDEPLNVDKVIPRALFSAVWNNCLWLARTQDNPSRVWWSALNAPDYFRYLSNDDDNYPAMGKDFLDINREDGDSLTGFYPFDKALLVFKRDSIHYFTGTPDSENPQANSFELLLGSKTIGCVSARTCQQLPGNNAVMFLGENAFYVWAPGAEPIQMYVIQPDIVDMKKDDKSQLKYDSVIDYKNNEYICTFSTTGSTNNITFHYNYINKTWWKENRGWQCLIKYEDANDDGHVIGGTTDGYMVQLYKKDTYDDYNSSVITGEVITGDYDGGSPEVLKIFRKIVIDFIPKTTAVTLTVNYRTDQSTWSADKVITLTGLQQGVRTTRYFDIYAQGTRIGVKVKHNTSSQNIIIYALHVDTGNVRRRAIGV